MIRRPRSGSARLSRSRRHAPVRHRQTTATTPASSCPLYSLSHPALRQCKTTMAAGARGVVRGGPAAYIRVSLSELENKHLGDGHLIVHDVLQAEARCGQPCSSTRQPSSFSTPASGSACWSICSPGWRSKVEAPYRGLRGPGGAAIQNKRRRERHGVLRGWRWAGCVRRAGGRFVIFREDGFDERGRWEGPPFRDYRLKSQPLKTHRTSQIHPGWTVFHLPSTPEA